MSRWGELIRHEEGEACLCGCQDEERCGNGWLIVDPDGTHLGCGDEPACEMGECCCHNKEAREACGWSE